MKTSELQQRPKQLFPSQKRARVIYY